MQSPVVEETHPTQADVQPPLPQLPQSCEQIVPQGGSLHVGPAGLPLVTLTIVGSFVTTGQVVDWPCDEVTTTVVEDDPPGGMGKVIVVVGNSEGVTRNVVLVMPGSVILKLYTGIYVEKSVVPSVWTKEESDYSPVMWSQAQT